MEVNIIYEDEHILVCAKPAGIPVQSARVGTKDMVSILKNYRKEKEQMMGDPYIGLIHRLDQPVQGVMVYAKTRLAAGNLSRQASDGRMKKQYLAVVCGIPSKKEGILEDYLVKNGKTNTSRIADAKTKGAKCAKLHYLVLKEYEEMALVQIDLYTGRHHQIRVQMAAAGMPLAGDRKYHGKIDGGGRTMVALAAWKLSFFHPVTGKEILFEKEPEQFFPQNE